MSKFLGGNPFFAGQTITYMDFLAYEWLDKQTYFAPKMVRKHWNLIEYLSRFEQLPTIKKYMNTDQFMKWPLYYPTAKFGSRFQ